MKDFKGDPLYAEGQIIAAVENPGAKLVIRKYYQRIYYCEIASDPTQKHLVYFENELVKPIRFKP
jgi:hypothetical protein